MRGMLGPAGGSDHPGEEHPPPLLLPPPSPLPPHPGTHTRAQTPDRWPRQMELCNAYRLYGAVSTTRVSGCPGEAGAADQVLPGPRALPPRPPPLCTGPAPSSSFLSFTSIFVFISNLTPPPAGRGAGRPHLHPRLPTLPPTPQDPQGLCLSP